MFRRVVVLCTVIAVLLSFAGCAQQAQSPQTHGGATGEWSSEHLQTDLYVTPTYSLVTSELIDTYFIACGLYYDFQSDFLFHPDMQVDYGQTIEHFTPYRDHPFIAFLEPYLDIENRYAPMDILYYLPQYILSVTTTGMGIGNLQSSSFAGDGEFYEFLDQLLASYNDCDGAAFFAGSRLHRELTQTVQDELDEIPVQALLEELQGYTNNQLERFGDSDVRYYSLISVYKSPYNATFHPIQIGNAVHLVSFQSPLGGSGVWDIDQTVETMVHESLHPYINPGVEAHRERIEALAQGKAPQDYTAPMYTGMPWHRITDEAVVRAVQARIYAAVGEDEETAYQQILQKEVDSGVANLEQMFRSLEIYERNREQYPAIDDYLDQLIDLYLDAQGAA